MENTDKKAPESLEPKFLEKYGMWIFVLGIIASIFLLNFLLKLIL